jgi:ATP-dependent Lhr-like helicase
MSSVFAIALNAAGLECSVHDLGITVADATTNEVKAIIGQLAARPSPPIHDIAEFVENLKTAKFDEHVPTSLLRRLWARANAETAAQLQDLANSLLRL